MKYIFLFVLLYSGICTSQTKGIIYYGQIESVTLKGPYGPDFNSYMVFNNEASYYVTAKDSLDAQTTFKRIYDNEDGSAGLSYGEYTNAIGRQVYYNRKVDSLYWNQWQTFYVAEKTPKINWELQNETKQIGNLLAYKARGKFRGRYYTAWYTLEIPLPYGPWKLQGLPGLILEAYDDDKELYLYFKSIEYPTTKNVRVKPIVWPEGMNKSWRSLEDFKKRLDWMYERQKNTSISIAQRMNTDVPEQKIKSEAFLESF